MTHEIIDQRSLAFDQAVAVRLRADPSLLQIASRNLERWLLTCCPRTRPALLEWQSIVEQGAEAALAMMERTDDHARWLRQSSPFCGIMTPAERLEIIKRFAKL